MRTRCCLDAEAAVHRGQDGRMHAQIRDLEDVHVRFEDPPGVSQLRTGAPGRNIVNLAVSQYQQRSVASDGAATGAGVAPKCLASRRDR